MFKIRFFSLLLFYATATQLIADDQILTNGKIYTVNDAQPWAQAMVVFDGVIEYVGSNEEANKYLNAETKLIDLKGKLVLPGFNDVHMHPLTAYAGTQDICILEGGEGISRHLAKLENCLEQQKDDDWFLGWGHWVDEVIDSQTLPKTLLDDLIPDKPAVIYSLSSHSNWVNSAALDVMGWNADTPNPTGGYIFKDELSGELTGIVFDNAADLMNELINAPSDEANDSAYYGLLEAMEEISKYGITSIADARVFWTRHHHDVWSRAEQEGTLQARSVLNLWVYPEDDDSQIEILESLYRNDMDSLLRVTGIKTYADGLIGNTTAAMKQPYVIDFGVANDNRGLNYIDEKRLTKYIAQLENTGFDFMIHAIGDRGVHEALNAIESAIEINGKDIDRRHRITHLDLIDDQDLPRFKTLDVIADFQFAGEWTHPADYNAFTSLFIGDRVDYAYQIKSVFDTGARVTLSSDFDVSSMNPLIGIENVLTRGDQSLPSLDDAIKAYTLNAAYALNLDDITGSLEPGKYADLIVLDKNIFELPEDQIASAKVLLTLLEGEEMFRHSSW